MPIIRKPKDIYNVEPILTEQGVKQLAAYISKLDAYQEEIDKLQAKQNQLYKEAACSFKESALRKMINSRAKIRSKNALKEKQRHKNFKKLKRAEIPLKDLEDYDNKGLKALSADDIVLLYESVLSVSNTKHRKVDVLNLSENIRLKRGKRKVAYRKYDPFGV